MDQGDTQRITASVAKIIGRRKLFGRSYIVKQVVKKNADGCFRNLYDITDGTEAHIACLQMGKGQVPGGITVYREAVPSALIVWLIGLPV